MECELSGPMATIQLALVKVLDGMLRQVQRGNKLDSSELALSHAFSRNFDATIKQQLNSIWNTVSQATRALIKDLRTVQDLLRYLLRFNCVSFLRYLQCLRAAAGPNTEWLMLSAANTVFQVRACGHAAALVLRTSSHAPWHEVHLARRTVATGQRAPAGGQGACLQGRQCAGAREQAAAAARAGGAAQVAAAATRRGGDSDAARHARVARACR